MCFIVTSHDYFNLFNMAYQFFFDQKMNDPSLLNPASLRGGWFVGPDEYEAMGYTLGLPPGFYAPDHPSIRQLVQSIKNQNGIILPSAIASPAVPAPKKKVMVRNFPNDVSPEDLGAFITSSLLKRKLITDPDPIVRVEILASRLHAFIEFKTQKDAEAAVMIGKSLIYGNRELNIFWPQIHQQSDIKQQTDYFDQQNTHDSLIIDSEMTLPDKEIIKSFIEESFPVDSIVQPEGFNHMLVNLVDPESADLAVYRLDGSVINKIPIRVKRCFISEGEGPNRLGPAHVHRMHTSAGPSPLLSTINPYLLDNPSIADILNPDVPVSMVVQPETERLQPLGGRTLCLYNIAKDLVLFDAELMNELLTDVVEECEHYGTVTDSRIEHLPIRSDYAVVKITFADPADTKEAQLALSGRRYAGRLCITSICD